MAGALDRVREARKAQRGTKSLTLAVPGWGGLLAVRYRPVEWDALSELLSRRTEDAADDLNANLDALIGACDALVVKGEDGDYVSLAAELRREGVDVVGELRFTEDAVDALDLGEDGERPEGSRATCLAVFGGAVSPELAVAEHAVRLGAWMRGTDNAAVESAVGESKGSPS